MSTLTDAPVSSPPAELLVGILAGSNAAVATDETTWAAVVEEARRQGVLSLLHARLTHLPAGCVPAAIAQPLRDRYTRIALNSALVFRELGWLLHALQQRQIPVLLLKGIHLAADVYQTRALRSMSDLDVMVPFDRLRDAADALHDAGFRMPDDAMIDIHQHCQRSNHLPRMTPPHGFSLGLEVHWNIELPTSPFDIRPAELWRHARPVVIDGREALVLSPELLLLHLCLHACYHHRFDHAPLKQLCDIAAVIRRYGDDIDWEVVVGTAERWRVQPYVRFTLLLARQLLAVPLPDLVTTALPADPDEARLLGNARAYILNRTLIVPHALAGVVRARGPLRKLRAAWRGLFPPPQRLAAIYGLPQRSRYVPLWYLFRPFDMLWRNGRATLALLLPGAARNRLQHREHNRVLLKYALREWAHISTSPSEHN